MKMRSFVAAAKIGFVLLLAHGVAAAAAAPEKVLLFPPG